MTQNIFNLYSAAIFNDHPVAVWNLDDDFSYLSLISASPVWTIQNGVSSSAQLEPNTNPNDTVGVGEINLALESFQGSGSSLITTLECQSFNSLDDLDAKISTFCVSAYIYSYNSNIASYKIGFKYRLNPTDPWLYEFSEFSNIGQYEWIKASHTFEWIKKIFGDQNVNTSLSVNFYPILIIQFNDQVNRNFSLYNFSVGQWSEQYNAETIGSVVSPLQSNSLSASFINSMGLLVTQYPYVSMYQTDVYGLNDLDNGYYLTYKNKMLAKNTKLPMVYGSGNITELYHPDAGASETDIAPVMPSIVLPGKGFLHQNGKYREMTCEFWLRINCESDSDVRIFGPIDSDDGLYVNKTFMTLKVGHKTKSYYVGKWQRPMLIDIRYNPLFISVLINGDLAISTEIEPRDTIFPNDIQYDNDWIGFYAYSSTYPFEIDCIAIYPYIVPEQAAKKKFVYGQGVAKPEEIIKKFGGKTTTVDFPFSEFTANITYPDMTRWDAGFYSNTQATSRTLSLPKYNLPEITYVGDNLQPFNIPRIRRSWQGLKNTSIWDDWEVGVWRSLSQTREANPLVDNYDSQSTLTENFYLKLTPNSIYESLYGAISFNSISQISDEVASIFVIASVNLNEISGLTNETDYMTIAYFKNRATGDYLTIAIPVSDLSKLQYIYNGEVIEEKSITIGYSDTLIAAGINFDNFSKNFSSKLKNFFSIKQNISLNVGGNAKDQFPGKIYRVTFDNKFFTNKDLLSYFDNNGSMLIDNNTISDLISYVGNYTLLFKKANSSMVMDIGSAGYWEDSIPMSSLGSYINNISGQPTYYDLDMIQFNIDIPSTSYLLNNLYNDNVSVYLTVQRYSDVGGISYSQYTNVVELNNNKYIDLDNSSINLDNTKFKIMDGTVIFPPKSLIDFKDAYITIHIEVKSNGTSTEQISINNMSVASLAYDQATLYALNSPTGNKLYPFTRQGASYSTKTKNPFLFYKDSTPYLYLTGDSGISCLPYDVYDNEENSNSYRGVSIPINQQKRENYQIHGIGMWVTYNKDKTFVGGTREKAFSIYSNDSNYIFYLEPEVEDIYYLNNRRAKLFAYKSEISGEVQDENIDLYQNGVLTETFVYPMLWSFVTIIFNEPIVFNESIGQLEIYPGLLVNNISIFETSINNKVDDIFESHLGLSNIVAQDNSSLAINSDGLDLFTDVKWTTFSGKPV